MAEINLGNDETINATLSTEEPITSEVLDINYIPGYVVAEQERRANEVVRQSNEANRIALYEDMEAKLESGYFNGQDGVGLEYDWQGTSLGVKREDESNYEYVNLKGETGSSGQDAKINGVNTLNVVAGDNIDISQSGSTMTISSTGGGGGATYTAGTGIEITAQNVINNTAPNKLISITADPQTMELDKTAGEINSLIEQGYLILLMGRLMFIEEYDSSRNKLYAYFYSGGYATKFTITGNQITSYESLDVVYDNHYTHTDNNYTNTDKNKLDGLENKIININANQQTLQLDKTADEINEYLNNGYIVMTLGYQVFRKDYNSSTHTIQLAIFFGSFGQVLTVVGNQVTGVSEYFYVNDQNYVHTDNNFSSYYKGKLDNAPEVVDLSSYQVGDTISDVAIISQLMNDSCKIKYGNTIYSYARLDNNIVRLYTVMADVDHGEYIALIIQGNDTLLFYEKENAYWEVPTNKVTSLSSSSTDTEYPSAKCVYDALQSAGGDVSYILYDGGGTFFSKTAVNLTTGTGTSHLNVNIHPEICNYLTILREKYGQGASVKLKVFFPSDIYLYGTFTLNNNAYIIEKLYSQNLVNEIPANSNGTNYVWDSSTNKYTTSKNYTDARRPSEFIPKTNNTLTYTPSGDYNPATKKYVDDKPTTYTGYDATKTQVLKNINGTLTWAENTYSTSETLTGKYWIDGKPIYRKVVDIGYLNSGSTTTAHNISNINFIIDGKGFFYNENDKTWFPIPRAYPTNPSQYDVAVDIGTTNITITSGTAYNGTVFKGYIIMEYTKTTD